ncbi:MAG TPA: ABC transporter ATP-binding protein [Streptosporangiaceae bacterium]
MSAVLVADRLVKSYRSVRAVHEISLEVAPGEIYGLLGPNGAGKTTTLSMITGILRPDSGSVHIDGVSITRARARGRLGLVPQEIALYPELTALENLHFFGHMQGRRGRDLQRRALDALAVVGLAGHAKKRTATFSGGMKRRLNIAVALVHSPDVIVLDEPTAGVDSQSRNAILDQVRQLADAGAAVVFASHYMDEVQRLCDRIGIIDGGEMVVTGTVSEILAKAVARPRFVLTADDRQYSELEDSLRTLAEVVETSVVRDELHVLVSDSSVNVTSLLHVAEIANVPLRGLQFIRPTLEDVFLELTGKALRE